jgi:immunoglobulin-like protein involved in spore germination
VLRTLWTVLLVVGLLSFGANAATESLRAISVRGAEHPSAIRVVIGFSGGALQVAKVTAVDPSPADGSAVLRIRGAGVAATARGTNIAGAGVQLAAAGGNLSISFRSDARRFKYLGYRLLRRPERLVVELWKTAPPRVTTTRGEGRCLTLTRWRVRARSATASGTERNLFEHMFVVNVRNEAGRVVGRRGVASSNGRWSTAVSYRVSRAQPGTLEAVDLSEGDGSLVCLAQVRVTLR